MDVSKPPPVKGGVVPYLIVDGAMKAADFYQRAFGAETVFRSTRSMTRGGPCTFTCTSMAIRSC